MKAPETNPPTHFKGKDAVEHVAEAQAKGIIAATEIHGTEIPGPIYAACDAARETAVALGLIALLLNLTTLSSLQIFYFLLLFAGGWLLWKAGRSAWLGWSRLERLHRVVAQEKWEIEHNRSQEREELAALYAAKGFEGKLLDDVLDVLMADGDRLLRVMVEEELGLSLESHEHPLKQSLGAAIGTFLASFLCLAMFFIYPPVGLIVGTFLSLIAASFVAAYYERNKEIPAICWNIGLGAISLGFVYFIAKYFF